MWNEKVDSNSHYRDTSCKPVDLNAPIPAFETGVNPDAWVKIPAGEFYFGQHNDIQTTDDFEIMVTDVTTAQYAAFLNKALMDGYVKVDGDQIVGYYPGDLISACSASTLRSNSRGRLAIYSIE